MIARAAPGTGGLVGAGRQGRGDWPRARARVPTRGAGTYVTLSTACGACVRSLPIHINAGTIGGTCGAVGACGQLGWEACTVLPAGIDATEGQPSGVHSIVRDTTAAATTTTTAPSTVTVAATTSINTRICTRNTCCKGSALSGHRSHQEQGDASRHVSLGQGQKTLNRQAFFEGRPRRPTAGKVNPRNRLQKALSTVLGASAGTTSAPACCEQRATPIIWYIVWSLLYPSGPTPRSLSVAR